MARQLAEGVGNSPGPSRSAPAARHGVAWHSVFLTFSRKGRCFMKPLTLSLFRNLGGKTLRKPVRPTFRPLLSKLEDRITPSGGLINPPPADGIDGDTETVPGITPQAAAAHRPRVSLSAYAGGIGGDSGVHGIDNRTGQERFAIQAFDPSFHGGVRVAIADMNEDRIPDIIVGAGPGGGPHVKIFDGATGQLMTNSPIASLMAFDPSFTGGVYVAGGDV